ncbi:MAG: HIT domain-containing protein, partial [Anaerolineales bacterium]
MFCRIIAGQAEASKVYQDDLVTAFMDRQPLIPGHLLVVSNEHAANLAGLDETIAGRMFVVGRQLAQ